MKCQICKDEVAEWAFQPFGPDEKPTFALIGSHYRGFPIVKVGVSCKNAFQTGDFEVKFAYKGHHYVGKDHRVSEVGISLWKELGTIAPTDLNPGPQGFMVMKDTPDNGPDLVALVFDNALLEAFLAAPRLLEACQELMMLREKIEFHLERAYERGYVAKDTHDAIFMALAKVIVAMEVQ